MRFEELLAEYQGPERIGEKIWALIVEVTGQTCRRYPPSVYADDFRWTPPAVEDLAQSVTLERLLGESQLDYIFARATADPARGLQTLRALLARQVRLTLARRRAPTVVDRLVKRMEALLEAPPDGLETRMVGSDLWIHTVSERRPAELAATDRHRGVHRIADIPRTPSNPRGERESKVYAAPQLEEVLRRLCHEYKGIYLGDVRRILEDLLTSWLPEILYDSEDVDPHVPSPPTDLELTDMTATLQGLLDQLATPHLVVMIGKSNGVADAQLAQRLGCSRPTVIKHKRECNELVGRFLADEVATERHHLAVEILLEAAVERLEVTA